MQRLNLLVCVAAMCAASSLAVLLDPRGARPVEQGTRSDKCAPEKEWPFCTDDQWGPKCPSGCRIQGLLDRFDDNSLRKIEKIRSLLEQNKAKHRSTDQVTKQTYDYLKDRLTIDAGNDNNYYNLAQTLRQRITDMKIKIDRQLRILGALKDRVKDQVVEMQRLEVDIDIKLRSCKGSCQSYTKYEVDHESYEALEKQVNQLDSRSAQNIESVGTLYVMKSRQLKDTVVNSLQKSKDVAGGQQRDNMFPDVQMVELMLEQEGSISSPATISKVSGTSYTQSTPSPGSSSSSSSSSGSITEFGGGGGLYRPSTSHVSTETITCTRSIRKTIIHTKDGPVEKIEEVMEGGPECQAMTDSTNHGLGSFFPGLTSSSSSSSSSSSLTKTVHSSGTKGSHLDLENPFGDDLGHFGAADADDDLPDFHARSVKSTRIERHADYVGKVCSRLKQQNQDGRQPSGHSRTHRKQRCRATAAAPLCSDDESVSKCPSGCRLQGLIWQTESEVESSLRKVCKTAQMYEDAAEKSMTAMTHIYSHNRRVIVNRHMSELALVERSEGLARNLTSLRRRSSRLSLQLQELSASVQKLMEDMYRTEVDIDMKLRACYGSCRSVLPFSVDRLGHRTLRADAERPDETLGRRTKAAPPPRGIPHVKLQPVDVGPAPPPEYRTIPAVRRELLTQFEDIGPAPPPEYRTIPAVRRELLTQFEDIGQNRVVVEELLLEARHPAGLRLTWE